MVLVRLTSFGEGRTGPGHVESEDQGSRDLLDRHDPDLRLGAGDRPGLHGDGEPGAILDGEGERRRLASEEQLRAETIRLEHGESTPFDVLQREEDLVGAESQKIFALQAYRDSLTALERAQGTILRNHNVVVEEALTLR